MQPTQAIGIMSNESSFYITEFDSAETCSLSLTGDTARTYELVPTSVCSPIIVGENIGLFYVFKPDRSRVHFNCLDEFCSECLLNIDVRNENECQEVQNQKFVVSKDNATIERRFVEIRNGSKLLSLFYNNPDFCHLGRII